jgi:hypothetical protein
LRRNAGSAAAGASAIDAGLSAALPSSSYGAEICEAHHVRWLSRGGRDALTNLVLVCPYHHRAIHRCEAPFDFAQTAFIFPRSVEPLTSLRHELSGD